MSKLETITIDTPSGSNTMQIGSTNTATINLGVSGDTINVPAGVTIANAGTATGFGGDMTPSFKVHIVSDQSVTSDTWTKVTFSGGTEHWDTDSAFSSDKFTVPSGEGGKYFVSAQLSHNSNATTDTSYVALKIYKNGSDAENLPSTMFYNDSTGIWRSDSINCHGLVSLSAGDYLEVYGRIKDLGSGSGPAFGTRIFQAHKLIGV